MRERIATIDELIDAIELGEAERAAYKAQARRVEPVAEAVAACLTGIARLAREARTALRGPRPAGARAR